MGLALGAFVVYGLVLLGVAAGGVLLLVFVAVLLAAALAPIVGWLRERLRFGRGATILVVYASFFVAVLGLAFVVVPAATGQAQQLLADLPPFIAEVRASAENLRPAALATSVTALLDSVASTFGTPPAPEPEAVVKVGTAVAEAVASLAVLLTIVFFWLVEHARLQRYVLAFLPAAQRPGAREAWNDIETRLGLWVRGQLILMGAIGLSTGIAYSVLGVPGALLLALIAAMAAPAARSPGR
jgi:predicted PurR-regulated permease PerM